MSVKRFISSAALWSLMAVGVSLAEPAEATGYFHYHYYQPYGYQYQYPNHGFRHYYRPHFYGHGYRPYFGYRGSYCPPKGFYSHDYYQPLIHYAIDAIVFHGFYGH